MGFAPILFKRFFLFLSSITFPINECEHPTHTPSSNVLYVSHLGVQTLHNLDLSSYENSEKPLENREGSTTKQAKAQSHETNFGKKRRSPACDGSSPY